MDEAGTFANWNGDVEVYLFIFKKITVFCWVSSHVCIVGNKMEDLAVKAALNLPYANLGIPYTDPKFHIHKYSTSNWQDESNNAGMNKLCSVKAALEDWQSSYRQSR